MNGARNQYASSWRFGLQPSRYVHPIAIEIVTLDDDIAKMQADSKDDSFGFGTVAVRVGNGLLEFDRRRQCIDCAGELARAPSPMSFTSLPP
jgi:hypothetical protein